MVYAFTLCTGIMRFLVWALGNRPATAVQWLCRVIWKSCSADAVAVQSPHILHGNHMVLMQARKGRAEVVW